MGNFFIEIDKVKRMTEFLIIYVKLKSFYLFVRNNAEE